ncbi:MAG: serine/threonine protein kinase [Planctomycetaceae bacterium]|nr:serine/threonine protein kinase [Planctomycetaceae bacterium]
MKFLKNILKRGPRVKKVDLSKRFDLITRVGQGSMSKVWRATDRMTGRMVAIKVLDKAKLIRLERRFVGMKKPDEGDIAMSLRHPNIVKTLEHGVTTNDEQYLVMEFVEGRGLSFYVDQQNDVMLANRLSFMIQLGQAVAYLHEQGWIHRDICPRNVVVTNDLTLKLIDFGLTVPNTEEFQKPGNRTGTASYMAPELVMRHRTDQRIDVFSYAVSCYEMCAHAYPWATGDTLESVLEHVNKPPEPLQKFVPNIDDELAKIIMKGLTRYPDDRWQTASKMVSALQKIRRRLEPVHADDE